MLPAAADVALAEKDEPEARKKLTRPSTIPQRTAILPGAGRTRPPRRQRRPMRSSTFAMWSCVLLKQSGEIWLVADLFIDANERRRKPRTLIARLRDEKADAVVVDFLEARLLLAEGKPNKAQELLRRNQAELTASET